MKRKWRDLPRYDPLPKSVPAILGRRGMCEDPLAARGSDEEVLSPFLPSLSIATLTTSACPGSTLLAGLATSREQLFLLYQPTKLSCYINRSTTIIPVFPPNFFFFFIESKKSRKKHMSVKDLRPMTATRLATPSRPSFSLVLRCIRCPGGRGSTSGLTSSSLK